MPRDWGSLIFNAAVAIAAALLAVGGTLYATHQQISAERQRAAEERQRREELQKKLETYTVRYENAPKAFTEQLGKLVETAPTYRNAPGTDTRILNPDPEYRQVILVRAKTIVAARDDLRSSLDAVGNRLDSQIDELKAELAKPNPDPERLVTLFDVLRQKWPSKQAEIELAVRKILTELGLVLNAGQ
jgi:chromosome segregation ATPase